MLTPEKIKALNAVSGFNTPTDGSPQVQSRADEIRSIAAKHTKPDDSFSGRVKQDLAARGEQMKSTIERAAAGTQSEFSTGYQVGGQGAGLIVDTAGEAVKSIPGYKTLESAQQQIESSPVGKAIPGIGQAATVKEVLGKALTALSPVWSSFSKDHPEAAANLEATANAFNLAGLISGGKAAVEAAPEIASAAKGFAQKVPGVASEVGTKTGEMFKSAKNKVAPLPSEEDLAGKITQAEPEELNASLKSLKSIDTKDVKTFKELSSKFQDKISENTKSVDLEAAKDTTPRKVQQLAKEVTDKDGKVIGKHNYVLDAVKQLKDYYGSVNDQVNLAKINNFEAKLNPTKGSGLTPTEIKEIARMHGRDLNAYNSNNELASGLKKQNAENTRQGVQDTFRGLLKDDITKGIDAETSNLIKTKNLVDEMDVKVQKLQNRFEKAGILQKTAAMVGKVVDMTTGGVLKGLWKGITGMGEMAGKTLNPIELQENLSKNLKLLDKLNKMEPKAALKEINKTFGL